MFKRFALVIFAYVLFLGASVTPVHIFPRVFEGPVSTTTPATVGTTTENIASTSAAKAQATTTKLANKPKMKPIVKPVAPKATTTTPEKPRETVNLPVIDPETINAFAREATVNILCMTKTSGLSPISGTGIVITKEGVILTNAHVAQYFLLRDFREKDFVDCVIRTGSPAYPRYHAELVYISPTWIDVNKGLLKEQNPKGTGENDFALLRITSSIDGSPLSEFTHIPVDIRENIDIGEPVVLVSYPAGFLGGIAILQNLNAASANTTVQDLATFSENKIDVISVGGTVVSQKGASGGAVVDKYGTLIGIISISTEATTTGARKLFAVTPAYINRTLQSEIKIGLATLLSKDTTEFAKVFNNSTAPLLTKILTDELNQQ